MCNVCNSFLILSLKNRKGICIWIHSANWHARNNVVTLKWYFFHPYYSFNEFIRNRWYFDSVIWLLLCWRTCDIHFYVYLYIKKSVCVAFIQKMLKDRDFNQFQIQVWRDDKHESFWMLLKKIQIFFFPFNISAMIDSFKNSTHLQHMKPAK